MLHKLKLEVIGLWRYYGGVLQSGHRVLQRSALQLQWWGGGGDGKGKGNKGGKGRVFSVYVIVERSFCGSEYVSRVSDTHTTEIIKFLGYEVTQLGFA